MEYPEYASRIHPALHYDGLPIDARSVCDAILAQSRGARDGEGAAAAAAMREAVTR
jgi:hypothetical protein